MSVIKHIDYHHGATDIDADIGSIAEYVDYDNSDNNFTKTNLQDVVDELIAESSYAVCSTSGSDVTKIATITNFELRAGAKAVIKFVNANTAANPKLNISNTGAKALLANGESADNAIKENGVFLVTYNGTAYDLVGGIGGLDGFVGTRAEWNALTAAQQAKFEGKLIYITDDYVTNGRLGHVIKNDNGNDLEQKDYLQFKNLSVINDNTNGITIVEADIQTEFNHYHGLCNKVTDIIPSGNDTVITETDSSDSVTSTTTIVQGSNITTITTVVVPTAGNYKYNKTTTIATVSGNPRITESYTKVTK